MTLRTRWAVAGLVGALMLGGCASGGDASDADPAVPDDTTGASDDATEDEAGDPLVGSYRLTSTVVASTIEGNEVGGDSDAEVTVYLSCWDEDCSSLAQRGYETGGWIGQTFRLTRDDGDTYRGLHVRRGPCGGEVDGEYEETFTLTLKPRGEGLGGTAKQRFGGCDGDKRVSATYRLTADPLDEPLPYPDAETAEAVTDALNEIDPLAEDLNSAYTACFKPSASAATVTACKAKAFRTWLDAAPAAVAAVTDISATAACGKAVAAVKPDKSVAAVRKAEVVNRRVADGGPSAGIDDVDAAAGSAVGDLYAALVRVGTMCTPPQDYAELGRDGVMTIDARSSYIPPLEG